MLDRLHAGHFAAAGSLSTLQIELVRGNVERIITKHLSKPNQRSAAAHWLNQIIEHVHKPLVEYVDPTMVLFDEGMLIKFQTIFTYLLGESDESLQDVASNSIVLLHKMAQQHDERVSRGDDPGAAVLKQTLVDTLVSTLTGKASRSAGGNKSQEKLAELALATQDAVLDIFEEVEVSSTKESSSSRQSSGKGASKSSSASSESVTTYKELCSLATEMGKPEMVYQFMNIVTHGRKIRGAQGATVATAKLLRSDDFDGFAFDDATLEFLLPRLFRGQFDPSPSVGTSMKSVLVEVAQSRQAPGSKPKLSDLLVPRLDAIMKLLLDTNETTGRLWRVREASAGALAEALVLCETKGENATVRILQWLPTALHLLLRLTDDIKETVRIAAKTSVSAVSSLIIRLADPTTDRVRRAKAREIESEPTLTNARDRVAVLIPMLADLLAVGLLLCIPPPPVR
jgi:proteasome component ECM29